MQTTLSTQCVFYLSGYVLLSFECLPPLALFSLGQEKGEERSKKKKQEGNRRTERETKRERKEERKRRSTQLLLTTWPSCFLRDWLKNGFMALLFSFLFHCPFTTACHICISVSGQCLTLQTWRPSLLTSSYLFYLECWMLNVSVYGHACRVLAANYEKHKRAVKN